MPYAVRTIALQLQSRLWQVSAMWDTLLLPPPLRLALLFCTLNPW